MVNGWYLADNGHERMSYQYQYDQRKRAVGLDDVTEKKRIKLFKELNQKVFEKIQNLS
jgi:hypothetical protein